MVRPLIDAMTRLRLVAVLVIPLGVACTDAPRRATDTARTASESSFAAMQTRGKMAMGVDQYTSTHHFDALPDGGRIVLERDTDDSAGVAAIRAHLHHIARAFQAGDFSMPEFVHMQSVPGTKEMAAKRDVITYEERDLPRGGEVRITTSDTAAVRAIHTFLDFQRHAHHSGGTP